ncbi:MAG: hypothetical protein M0D57_18610 [Sphingobacteriales bacterium JAD_PAG50586_3]|nr:MAG: hypothetical protein M0D57_18610 [Sphingobacteriales bacterium JAD_PAG50586_3]
MKRYLTWFLLLPAFWPGSTVLAQTGKVLTEYVIVNGDTIPAIGYDPFVVKGKREFSSKKKEAAYEKLLLG